MDSTLSKELTQQQQILEAIQKKLQEPELADINRTLNMTEYNAIRKVLLKRPALFLLLLSSPVFDLFLTPNTREGFLKDLKENPEQIKSRLKAIQRARDIPLPTENQVFESRQEISGSHIDEEVGLVKEVKETINEIYDQVASFAAVYTPSLDSFSSFVDELTCALPTMEGPVDGMQADAAEQGGVKQKKLTSSPK